MELISQHPFLRGSPQINELVPLVGLVQVSACRFYNLRNSYMRPRSSMYLEVEDFRLNE